MSTHHTGRPWLRRRMQVLDRDQWTCMVERCRFPSRTIPRTPPRRWHPVSASVDMIVPKAHGGSDRDIENLRAAHYGCNSARGAGGRLPRSTISPPRVG